MRCIIETQKKNLVGIGVNFYANELKIDYPFIAGKEKFDKPQFAALSLVYGKRFHQLDGLIEIGYIVQNVVKLESDDKLKDYQVRGVTAGLSVHVPTVFRIKPTQFYLSNDREYFFGINFHGGVKYNLFSFEELNGLMLEVGVGMRLHRDM